MCDKMTMKNNVIDVVFMIRKDMETRDLLDIGLGVEMTFGTDRTVFNKAIDIFAMEGYPVYVVSIPSILNKSVAINNKFLCKPGTTPADIYKNFGRMGIIVKGEQ